ncbi:hypothetical protein AKUA2103_PHAGE100460 (plasmid) [Apilactobacillus kunkeei]|nr:hypothetical protein AKUA2103_PHAGE100460 [Apilactobacillus kunkeei]CAI2699684.1 hypothetical protein AKUA1003_PHAGE100460 [Apilactobacillus kunkeei]
MSDLQELLENHQIKKTVTWTEEGEEHSREITLQEPDARAATQIIGKMAGANNTIYFGDAMGLILDNNVIVNPKITFNQLNHDLSKEDAQKSVELTNADGRKVTLYMKFPDYRTAFNILMFSQKTDGSIDITGMLDLLFDGILVDGNGKKLDWDWLDDHKKGYGLTNEVISEALEFITDVLSKDGVLAMLLEAFQLSAKQISRVR